MNLFELFVKIGVDDQASDKLSDLSSKLGNGLKTAAKVGTAAVGAAAAGITALTTAAVNNYAEYEQLVGGIDTLFGTMGAMDVYEYAAITGKEVTEELKSQFETLIWAGELAKDNAAKAYKSAGLSANEYMDTITSMAAALKQTTEDEYAAAEAADMAVIDMADNANKMGTSMEMIQNAYQGFAKQNYTMLDNLKLGYGGTKEEMVRLVDDANKILESQGEVGNLVTANFADVVKAIHVIQTEMGITGTTAKEAGTTIQGSVASMKSAWTNLLTGLADSNADIEQLVDNLVTTIVGDGTESNLGVLGNILPAVETALNGASALVSKALPKIMEIIPAIINDNLPVFAEAAVGIIQSLIDGISQNQEALFDTIFGVITYLAESFITMLPQIVDLGLDLIVSLANGIAESLPELIPTIVDVAIQIVETLIDNVDMMIDASIAIIVALAEGLINSLPKLVEKAPEIIVKLVEAFVNNAPKLLTAALTMIVTLAKGLITSIPELIASIPQIVTAIVGGFMSFMGKIKDIGKNIVTGIWEGIQGMASWIKDKITGFFSGIVSGVKEFLGIKSPSKVFASIGGFMAEGLGDGWDDEYGNIKKQIEKDMDFGTATVDFASSGLGASSVNIINSAVSANESNPVGWPVTINLMLPDGTQLASYLLPNLINVAKASGTPIVNPA